MDKVREKFIKQDISLEEYTREAVLSTIDFLEEDYNYEFVQEIGRGSFGSVLELKNENKQSRLAVKVVIDEFVAEGEKVLWPNLSHENILPLINVEYIVSTYTYIFITPVHHSSLCNIVQSYDLVKDRNGIQKAEYWLRGICRGINYLHQGGLCHLDLKISNVLISDNSTPIICDFGSLTRTVGPTKKLVQLFFK